MLQPRPRRLRNTAARIASLRWIVAGELVIVVGLFLVYEYARLLIGPSQAEAFRNADHVLGWERMLRLPSEHNIQDLLLVDDSIAKLANVLYANVHFPLTALFLVWLFARSRRHYFHLRTVLALMTGAALVIHNAFPLAPPRMLGGRGFVDTAQVFGPAVYNASPQAESVANQFAAMPSLHFGWAVVVAVGVIRAGRSPLRWLWIAHPTLTLLVIVGTANHYWLDAIVAGALLAAADFAVRHWSPARRLAQPFRLRRTRRGALELQSPADGVALGLVDGGLERQHQGLDGQRLVSFDDRLDGLGVATGVAVERPQPLPEQAGQLVRDGAPVLGEDPGRVPRDVDRDTEFEQPDSDAEVRRGDPEHVVVGRGLDGADRGEQLEVGVG